ncbi:MAG: iron-sulfur cluster assembly scaffold protein [Gammaproteobacteria bacterium]
MNDSFYHDKIMALAKTRRDDKPLCGRGVLRARLDNPLCGDSVQLSARGDAKNITRIAQEVRGCVLCGAAMRLILDIAARDSERAGLEMLCAEAENMFLQKRPAPALEIFSPVVAYPARHECVLLPFRALAEIIKQTPPA